jgi:hypothetical protein
MFIECHEVLNTTELAQLEGVESVKTLRNQIHSLILKNVFARCGAQWEVKKGRMLHRTWQAILLHCEQPYSRNDRQGLNSNVRP